MLLDKAVLENPYPFYQRLREDAPVWKVPGTKIVIVSDYALLDEASKRVEDFSSNMTSVLFKKRSGLPGRLSRRAGIMELLPTADPPVHGRQKAVVLPSFSPKRIADLQTEIEAVADSHVGDAVARGNVEFMSAVANPLPMKIVSDLVGFRSSNIDTLLQAAFDSTAIVSGSSTLPRLLMRFLRSFFIQRWMVCQLDSTALDDSHIIGSIKRCVDDGTLTKMEGTGLLHLFLAAGGESTTSLLGSAVRILADDQALQQKLREQPELISSFYEEVLRLESPFRSMLRSTHKDTTLGGVDIPAGSTVLLYWGAGNRDPKVFNNPDVIDLERPRRHLAFGRGIHTCVGAPLARLEAQTVLSKLLEQTSSIALDPQSPPQWVESAQVRRYEKLSLLLTPR